MPPAGEVNRRSAASDYECKKAQSGLQAGQSSAATWPCGQGSTQSAAAWIGQFSSQMRFDSVCGGQVHPWAMAAGLPGWGCVLFIASPDRL